MPPSYRDRLRLEGAVLAACGLVGSALLLALTQTATDGPASTLGQLAFVAVALAVIGPRAVRRWAAAAGDVRAADVPGDPTPLWLLPVICLALTLLVGAPTGAWDAGLRVTGGCALVGLAQAVVLERVAAREEARLGATLVRLPGSSLLRGTRLGAVRG